MKRYIEYVITFCVCAAITLIVIFLRGILKTSEAYGVMRCLSDGFFVAGVFALACGGLAFAGSRGILDAFIFTLRKVWVSLHSREYRQNHKMTYEEYRDKKSKKVRRTAHFFAVGGIFAALGILFTILFYCFR